MAGKWAKLVSALPKFQGNDPTYQARVDRVKNLITADSPVSTTTPEGETLGLVDLGKAQANYRASFTVIDKAVNYATQWLLYQARGRRYASVYAQGYRDARLLQEKLAAQANAVGLLLEAYTQLFDEQAEVESVSQLKLDDDGSKLRTQPEPYASVEDRDKLREWLMANNYERELALPWQTLNSIAKDCLEAGLEPPPGVKIWSKTKMVFERGKEGK